MDVTKHNLPSGNTLEERLDSPYPYIRIYARIEKNKIEKEKLDNWFMNLSEEENLNSDSPSHSGTWERDDDVKEKYDDEYRKWLQEKESIEQWFYTYNK